jgi:hypothetical protein
MLPACLPPTPSSSVLQLPRFRPLAQLGRRTAILQLLLVILTGRCFAAAESMTSPVAAPPAPVVLGQKLERAALPRGERPERATPPLKLPIGQRVYRTVVELDLESPLRPGTRVDVWHATLGDEGPTARRMLRGVAVVSVEPATGGVSDVVIAADSPEQDGDGEKGHDGYYATAIVGLAVSGGQLEQLRMADAQGVLRLRPAAVVSTGSPLRDIARNFVSNLFQPLLLFFFMGFAVPLLKVPFEFPKALYQSLVIYLLVAIGWHGGELMAHLPTSELAVAGGLAAVGFVANTLIGLAATGILRVVTPMRRIDAVTVGAYYGSDSAGTFVTCLGILAALGILHDSYMPVMLAVMEIPGCLVGLALVSRLRSSGMDDGGNMPGERGYAGAGHSGKPATSILSPKVLHEVFLNPGLFLLFGGIIVGFISGRQALEDPSIVEGPNHLFLFMFKGALCLFLLEMGMTACHRLRDLKTAGWGFIAFGLFAPVAFATFGMVLLHAYSLLLGHRFELGTYALFAVLCGAASYIAVPAVQRIAIPEASPTLPLAASLGLTFTWNVTVGIPIYIEIARWIVATVPLAA